MSESSDNRNVRNDEIDLLDLFARMGKTLSRWLNALGTAFLIATVFLIKRWLPLGLSILVGIGGSYFIKATAESNYTSDLILRSNAAPASDLINYINRLHQFCLEENQMALSEALSLSSETSENIIDINSYWVIDNGFDSIPDFIDYKEVHDIYDTINVRMKDRFDISVKIKSPQNLALVRDGLISFIEKDSLFQQKNRIRQNQNKDLIARFDYDIIQLDSLQKVKYFEETRNRQPVGGGQMIFLQEQNTQLIHWDIYNLYERKQQLELETSLYGDIVTILSDFSIPNERVNGTFYYLKILVPVCFGLTLLGLILIASHNRLKIVYEKYK